MSKEAVTLQQRAREFPCRLSHGGCGARPGEYCRTWAGRKSYQAHFDRLKQENEDWQRRNGREFPVRQEAP